MFSLTHRLHSVKVWWTCRCRPSSKVPNSDRQLRKNDSFFAITLLLSPQGFSIGVIFESTWQWYLQNNCNKCQPHFPYTKLLIPKTIRNRKGDCFWGCARGINTTWENLQIEKHKSFRWAERTPSWFCAFRSADFLRWCLFPERNLKHNLFFSFQLILVLISFIFPNRRRTMQPEIRSFVSVPCHPIW